MGLWDKIKGEFIDIIEWLDASSDTMVHRFERHENEIKNGAKLTVRESQVAVFINEGQLADVFKPGMYTLTTENLPILSTLKGWKYGFNSPFKAEVYFVNTKQFTDLKWGTPNPIMLRDAEFGPIRIRAFGNYSMRVVDAAKFIREVVGTDGNFTSDKITDQLKNLVVTRFTDAVGESKIPVLDMAANYNEFSKFVETQLKPEFQEYGIDLTKLLVSNISLPPNVEEALDKRSTLGIMGGIGQYTQVQTADAILAAANNPSSGGMAGAGMGMGMGMSMGSTMMGAMNQAQQPQQQQGAGAPPPLVQFFLVLNGQQAGPFDMNGLKQHVAGGQLTPETLVWKNGLANWIPASQVVELASLFQTPPPIAPPVPPVG
ncbi:MAG: antifreeze protein [Bacteroidetes bacterium HGW-Bacteroidetes-21]|jgi:membrane protease subunit (stomatin/prohibitin family)|nr:MAG: antifreeze protein [Bacteroidetes bacterium HGW-Bacteroidetes-21]